MVSTRISKLYFLKQVFLKNQCHFVYNFYECSKGSISLNSHAPTESTAATCTERTIRKSCLNYYITYENILKFILKFRFLFEVSSPAIFPPIKISKISISPFLPSSNKRKKTWWWGWSL